MRVGPDVIAATRTRPVLLLPLLIGAGALLRAAGLPSELWFDEIESIQFVQPLRHVGQVLWSLHTDNKHHLIWLWDWLLGPGRADWLYRVPSYVAGVALLPVMFLVIRRRHGSFAAMASAAGAAVCYPLILYSSEARGYALATLAGVLAYGWAPAGEHAESPRRAAAFGVTVVLGFLSHLTFIYLYAGLMAWAFVEVVRRPRWTLLAYHGPAALALAALWWFDVRHLTYGGGPSTTAQDTLRWAASLSFGVPVSTSWACTTLAAVGLLASVGVWRVARQYGPGPAAFFLVALLLAPAVLTANRRNTFLAVRYFLVLFPFVLLLIAIGADAGRWFRAIGGALLLALAVSGVRSSLQLYKLGRGHVRAALLTMQQNTPGSEVDFGSARPIMDDACVRYYQPTLPGHIAFVDMAGAGSARPPQWWILDLDDPSLMGPPMLHRGGRTYRLDSIFPSIPVSGLTWDLYRLQP